MSIQEAKAEELELVDTLLLPLEDGVWINHINSLHSKYSVPHLHVNFTGNPLKLAQLEKSLYEFGVNQRPTLIQV